MNSLRLLTLIGFGYPAATIDEYYAVFLGAI